MNPATSAMLASLATERSHVLRAVDGLDDEAMRRSLVLSGWTIAQLLHHLAYDDEMFWVGAVLGADASAIEALHDGWATPVTTGAAAVDAYRREIERSDRVLASVDLDAPPAWWPPIEIAGGPPMHDGHTVLARVLVETSVHAGQLDIVRELIDGRQHIVVG